MSDPFVAEIKIFAGNFAPRNWTFCDGALLPIAQNTALFSLIGTTYGGDGRTTTGLPDLRGRAPMHPGNGPGLSQRRLGTRGGVTEVTLTDAQMPAHGHTMVGSTRPAEENDAAGQYTARPAGPLLYSDDVTPANVQPMADQSLPPFGSPGPHNNRQPFLAMFFIIALTGIFPSRN